MKVSFFEKLSTWQYKPYAHFTGIDHQHIFAFIAMYEDENNRGKL